MVHGGRIQTTNLTCPSFFVTLLFLMALGYVYPLSLPAYGDTRMGEDWITVTIGAHKQAEVKMATTFSASPLLVFDVLTDYPHWPNLFPTPPHIDHIKREEGYVIVDMAIPMSFLPMQLRLVTATKETRPSQVKTQLVRGDFERYDWTWKFLPATIPGQTKAFLILHVQPKIWIPDWLFRWVLKSNLEQHVALLRKAVLAHHQSSLSDSSQGLP